MIIMDLPHGRIAVPGPSRTAFPSNITTHDRRDALKIAQFINLSTII